MHKGGVGLILRARLSGTGGGTPTHIFCKNQ